MSDVEKNIDSVEQKTETKKPSPLKRFLPLLIIVGIVATIGGIWYVVNQGKYIYSEKASLSAPMIKITAHSQGVLKKVEVDAGAIVAAHQALARVGLETLYSEVAGKIISVQKDYGTIYNSGQAVLTMIEPSEMKVVARIDEDKGIKDIKVGQKAIFTVDAYGSREFEGTVATIHPTTKEGDVVFNISDKRETKQFEVEIGYDHEHLPVFQNGMSARVWIIKG